MRFGMVTTFYPPYSYGGDATYVRNLARTLVAEGHEVEVIASTDAYLVRTKDENPIDPTVHDGVKVHRLRHPAGVLAPLISQQTGHPGLHTPALKAFFAKPFDVLHFHNISLMGGPAVVRMGEARARVMTLHDHWLTCPTHVLWKNGNRACDRRTCFTCSVRTGIPPQLWRYTSLRNHSLGTVDRILAPSRFIADMHRANGVETPMEVLPLFSSIEGPAKPKVHARRILFAGRITTLKGVDMLLRVMAGMPDIELVLVGGGELQSSLAQAYAKCPNIRFVGKVDQEELVEYYSTATAMVLPTLVPENFPLAVVEAAACGTPSIVSGEPGGAAELVGAMGGGLLYRGEAELAEAIQRLVEDRQLRDELGANARAAYVERYTMERHIAAYLRQIDEILQNKR